MIRLMIGRDLKSLYTPPAMSPGDPVLELQELRTTSFPDQAVSLDVRKGEILGLAGLVGSGRTELARAVFGIDRHLGGSIHLAGEPVLIRTPRDAINRGLYLVPEDRKRESLLLDVSIAANVSLADLRAYTRGLLVQTRAETENAERQRQKLNIKAASVATEVGTLSGGNQQKVALGRLLHQDADVLLLDEPARGIDVGAKADIFREITELAAAGKAILMVSSYLPELFAVCHRIAVVHRGRLSAAQPVAEWTPDSILQVAVGGESAA